MQKDGDWQPQRVGAEREHQQSHVHRPLGAGGHKALPPALHLLGKERVEEEEEEEEDEWSRKMVHWKFGTKTWVVSVYYNKTASI